MRVDPDMIHATAGEAVVTASDPVTADSGLPDEIAQELLRLRRMADRLDEYGDPLNRKQRRARAAQSRKIQAGVARIKRMALGSGNGLGSPPSTLKR